MKFHDSSGAVLTIGAKLGQGGEGSVYATNEHPGVVAKIYSKPLTDQHVAKLEAMVSSGDDALRSVAAWPIGTLYHKSKPVGFTMPLVTARHQLHDLIGPRQRQTLFPNAHWAFLIHTAINLARAFDVLHSRNVIIGDVNSTNVVVDRDSTARLIDCDSFQMRTGATVFRCNVGVPEYQPPELQHSDLSRIDRVPAHDLFGLAVMIFQLLFVGKHPFAGVLPGHIDETEIGANVAAKRFFYAPEARRMGLHPPPGSLTLAALTPQVSAHFRHAFLGEPERRPSAGSWLTALHDLKSRTVTCKTNRAHRFVRGRDCPWCALERRGLAYFSGPQLAAPTAPVDDSIWQRFTNDDVERVWAQIERLTPPPFDPVIRKTRRYRRAPLGLWTPRLRSAYLQSALLAGLPALAIWMFARPWAAAAWAALAVWLVIAAVLRPDARTVARERWKRRTAARESYEAVARRWSRVARGSAFVEERERLAAVRRHLLDQRARYDAELARLEREHDAQALHDFLKSQTVAGARISDIGAQDRGLLRSVGLSSAADVGWPAVRYAPLPDHLLTWRRNLEQQFRQQPRDGKPAINEKALRELKIRHAAERIDNRAQLIAGLTTLEHIAEEIEQQRPSLGALARERAEILWQAEADASISPLFYKTGRF